MSYVNQTDPTSRAAALAGVGAIHVLIAAGLLAGLAIDYVKGEEDRPFEGTMVDLPPPPVPEPTIEPDPAPSAVETPRVTAPIPLFPTTSKPDIRVDPIGPALPSGDFFPVPAPSPFLPEPSPSPTFTAAGPAPLNGPAGWITTEDYPRTALVRGWEGSLRYEVSVGADGRVQDCRVTSSSGHGALDEAACKYVARRARFDPGIDAAGRKVAGSYQGSVTWRIPE